MTELPLTGNYLEDILKLSAFMVFPNDESLRDTFFTHIEREKILANTQDEEVTVPRSILNTIGYDISSKDLVLKGNTAREKGHVGGSVLYYLAMLDSENQASLLKAKWVVEMDLGKAKTLDGKSVVSSHQSINDAWKFYLPVVHLWAAHRFLTGKYRVTRKDNDPAINENKEDFREFIATANWFSQFLLDYVPTRSRNKTTLVQAHELHIIPQSIYPITLEQPLFKSIDPNIKNLLTTEYTYRNKYVIKQ